MASSYEAMRRRAGIEVRDRPLQKRGALIRCDGELHLYLNENLRGADLLFVGFHELAHYWLHPLRTRFFSRMNGIIETETNIVAACAMIPITLLTHYRLSEITE